MAPSDITSNMNVYVTHSDTIGVPYVLDINHTTHEVIIRTYPTTDMLSHVPLIWSYAQTYIKMASLIMGDLYLCEAHVIIP